MSRYFDLPAKPFRVDGRLADGGTSIALDGFEVRLGEIVLEVEAGVVGGEEDGAAGTEDTPEEHLYTTPEDMLAVHEALDGIEAFCGQRPRSWESPGLTENEDTLDSVQEQSEAAGKLFDTDRFFVMPIPISNPTIGTGLGATPAVSGIGNPAGTASRMPTWSARISGGKNPKYVVPV